MAFHVVSDLHIRGSDDPLCHSLQMLIRDRVREGDVLVLAGDVFDMFVGGKAVFLERYHAFFEEVDRAAARGARVHYIEGNHDFLMRKAFAKRAPSVQVHAHHMTEDLAGKRFYVAHGDTIDREDYGYLALRAFFRSPFIRAFVQVAPGKLIDWIGAKGSRNSETSFRHKRKEHKIDPRLKRFERTRKVFRSFAAEKLAEGFDFVVLGHCHDLDEMRFQIGGRRGHYVNVGYPRAHGSFVTWSAGDDELRREPLP